MWNSGLHFSKDKIYFWFFQETQKLNEIHLILSFEHIDLLIPLTCTILTEVMIEEIFFLKQADSKNT